jgi:hypothetical protein
MAGSIVFPVCSLFLQSLAEEENKARTGRAAFTPPTVGQYTSIDL